MSPRYASLDGSVLLFAHRGASAHARENTLEAFELGVRLGANGLESDAWVTADGQAVLDHDGAVGPRLRRRQIADLSRAELPEHIPSLDDLYRHVGASMALSIDVKDPNAFAAIIETARAHGEDAERNLWLCTSHFDSLVEWRPRTTARLVSSVKLRPLKERPEQYVARLREYDIDVLNLPQLEWSGGLVALAHRFGRYAFGWGAQHEREIAKLIDIGIDGIYSNHVDRLTAVADLYYPPVDEA